MPRLMRWVPHRHRWEAWSVTWRDLTEGSRLEYGATWAECTRCPAVWPREAMIYRQLPGARRERAWLRLS